MFSHAGSQAETPNHFPRCALEMGSVQSYNMKIDVAAVLPACLSQWVTPGPSFHFIYSVTPLSSRPRSHAPPPPPPPRLFTLCPPPLSVLQCFTPSIGCSHRRLIYSHCCLKRGAFVCHRQRSHGAMKGATARLETTLRSLLRPRSLACMCVGGTEFMCVK